jgi:DNA-binding CsgD family transcriptional regulator
MKLKAPYKIIIIHPILIIREGLRSIISDSFDVETIVLSELKELDNFVEFKSKKLLFIVDADCDHRVLEPKIESYSSKSKVEKVLVRQPGSSDVDCDDNCLCCFYVDSKKERIEYLLKQYLSSNGITDDEETRNNGLTLRELEVVKLIALGKTNKEIAHQLSISIHTVISHRKNITEKLGIKSISGLTVYAILNQLIDTNSIDPESLI